MANLPPKALAAVEPRARSTTGELLPLADLVTALFESGTKWIRISGEGKTTAIAHLKARLEDGLKVNFIDHGKQVSSSKLPDRAVFTSPTHLKGCVELKINRWSRDDCIEYLMAKAPDQCKSVMGRILQSGDLWLASGSPRALSRCLDLMLADEKIASLESAISTCFDRIAFKRDRHRQQVIAKCVEHLFDDSKFAMDMLKLARRFKLAEDAKFLFIQTIRYVVTAKHLIEILEKQKLPDCFRRLWTPMWIEYFAKALVQEDAQSAIEFLDSIANKIWNENSGNAASLLYELDSSWRPQRTTELNFEKVQLPRIEAHELMLENSLMTRANLVQANLAYGSLSNTNVIGSDFFEANLTHANLIRLSAKHSNFGAARLCHVDADHSDFRCTSLRSANLQAGCFTHADFRRADLTNANLDAANLSRADLSNCNLNGASLVGTIFEGTKLRRIRFCDTHLAQCRFRGSDLENANFEQVVLDDINFENCYCVSTLFTGSQFHCCSLRSSNLIGAKLGDVIWTDCDLRFIEFAGCQFHYGSTRSGLVGSPYPSHGTRTGFYTDDYDDQQFKRIEDIRKASLQGCNLTGARVEQADFYLVDLRDAIYDENQRRHFESCGAILHD